MSSDGGGTHLTIMVVPDGAQESRNYRLSYRALKALAALGGVLGVLLLVMLGSWWFLASKASRIPELEARIAEMAQDSVRIQELATQLQAMEAQYEQIRVLFGPDLPDEVSGVWEPPPSGRPRPGSPERVTGATLPELWPLTEDGFVTQGLLAQEEGDHPGLDIAVPADSYIRASGGGTVVDVGEDDVYGRFVVLDHGDGYTSLYGHASLTLVDRGRRVRQGEVIALSGSTGHSTAPHLHFEILHNGEAIDPLTLVSQP